METYPHLVSSQIPHTLSGTPELGGGDYPPCLLLGGAGGLEVPFRF